MDIRWKNKLKRLVFKFSVLDLFLIIIAIYATFLCSINIKHYINYASYDIGQTSSLKIIKTILTSDDEKYASLAKQNSINRYKELFDKTDEFVKNTLEEYKDLDNQEEFNNFTKKIIENYNDMTGIVLINNTKNFMLTNEPGIGIENHVINGEDQEQAKSEVINQTKDNIDDTQYKISYIKFKKLNMNSLYNYLNKHESYFTKEDEFTINNENYTLLMFKNTYYNDTPIFYMGLESIRKNIFKLFILILINIIYIIKLIYNIKKYKGNIIKETIKDEPLIQWYGNKPVEGKIKFNYGFIIVLILLSIMSILGILRTSIFFILFNGSIICILIFFNMYRSFGIIRLKKQLKNIISGENNNNNFNLLGLKDIGMLLNDVTNGYNKAVSENIKNEKLKTELITNVSHDLKTPLTSIINYVDILNREDLSEEERKEYLSILDRKANKLKSLINDLFEISKLSSGKIDLEIKRIDLIELLHQSLGECTPVYSNKNIDFKINSDEDILMEYVDPQKFSRVFENLIVNAYKYSLEGTRVYIDINSLDNKVIIAFKNISSYELNFDGKELFERFTRGDLARSSKIDGAGLGLAIAKSIVELHGGEMKIDIEGDMFKVYIILDKYR
ncbi:sensor histidine kinase [Clostridium fallax]|uniref:histidine kinase n=1 Tax=Clostridium fallax TaxID=1533 RepID=A0A1M4TTU9_9CLOT|nr:HAMP domain-containing sensor histidine kinase [Clostridium fallax]SHE47836.1 Histidine kinase-, DNA gyrase B-, and HSP90-like ATPase [Clostridium fallax]SQB22400.1 two-component sensor histidine kinase [Clostridium fallax]